uniref:Uncharacterized protein n=1 Tax=Marseillevirus LCMAC101 TaxID=2506602 RepID=A0A481YT06_9VIRU|nr:MAG: hypothetical protein LCMAC101_05000 [Marseillevirus LCMAC101]
MENINSKTSLDIGDRISKLFGARNVYGQYKVNTSREVLVFDDVIGSQIKIGKNIYVIMLTSYKSLLTTEVVKPWSWNRYWYGTQPMVKFVLSSSRAADIKVTADFHFNKSQMVYYPYLIITDVEESDEEEIYKLFQNIGLSSNKIVFMSKNSDTSNKRLQVMVKLIETKLRHVE